MKRYFMCLSDNGESELYISTQYESQQQKIQSMWHVLIRWFSIARVQRYAQSFYVMLSLYVGTQAQFLGFLPQSSWVFYVSSPSLILQTSANQEHSIRTCPCTLFLFYKALPQVISYFPVSSVSILPPWCRGCMRLTLF